MTSSSPTTNLPPASPSNQHWRWRIHTGPGVFHVDWDNEAPVTLHGQLAFFSQFLHAGDMFASWHRDCPLQYRSNNAPRVSDVLGTLLVSAIAGHTRYRHIGSVYADTVAAELLGINKLVSTDSARRALARLEEQQAETWQLDHLKRTYEALLVHEYILDVDSSVKPLYGHQEGAAVGYNPKKPGRPSHAYHVYFIGGLRIVLDVEVRPGNQTAGLYSRPGLWRLLASLPRSLWPTLIRGDIGYGNEGTMCECEERDQKYLFKVKMTPGGKNLVRQIERSGQAWEDAGGSWSGCCATLRLNGWSRERRVVVLRRRTGKPRGSTAPGLPAPGQALLPFAEVVESGPDYEYAILVTNLQLSVLSVAQLYRDRADCENVLDELKNQWGWSGFTTQDLKRSQIMARIVALVYNWWNIFCRLAEPARHLEAVTSRPLLLSTIGRLVKSGGKRLIRLTSLNARAEEVKTTMSSICAYLEEVISTASQSTPEERLAAILSRAFSRFTGCRQLRAIADGRQLLLEY